MKKIISAMTVLLLVSHLHAGHDPKYRSPMSVEGTSNIDIIEAKTLFDDGVFFLDVRQNTAYEEGRIPSSVSFPIKEIIKEEKKKEKKIKKRLEMAIHGSLKDLNRNKKIVIYCSGVKCSRSSMAAERLVKYGYKNIYYFRDGFPIWKDKGYPVE